ncbi:MAG TPA: HAD family hydrolase [Candidatus Hydrogenedentes bacterium]|nr:HAD family hydrolase [Candidatus Hydrogenedentota bacterium]HPG68893.1 HAD family hydrolase [Candidatus Hydrogenedentota bacterium]
MQKPTAILFDMGGVLLDPADHWDLDGFRQSFPDGLDEPELEPWFLDMSADIMATFVALEPPRPAMDARPFVEVWLWKRGQPPTPELVDHWLDMLERWEARPVYPFVPEALKTLRDRGFRLGVVSNTIMPATYIRQRFAETGILDLFECLAFSAERGINKPSPTLFRYVLDAMGVDSGDAWYVGDKPQRDVRGAHGVGMTAVLVDSRFAKHVHDAPENMPDLRIKDIADLPGLMAE